MVDWEIKFLHWFLIGGESCFRWEWVEWLVKVDEVLHVKIDCLLLWLILYVKGQNVENPLFLFDDFFALCNDQLLNFVQELLKIVTVNQCEIKIIVQSFVTIHQSTLL